MLFLIVAGSFRSTEKQYCSIDNTEQEPGPSFVDLTSTTSHHIAPDTGLEPGPSFATSKISYQAPSPSEVDHTERESGFSYDHYSAVNTHYCLYCKTAQSKIHRHLRLKHSNERDVHDAIKDSTPFVVIINRGDLDHNLKSRLNHGGTIVVLRRPTGELKIEDYTPCPYCFGFVKKSDLWQHCHIRCTARPQDEERNDRGLLFRSKCLLEKTERGAVTPEFRNAVLVSLKEDEITQALQNDTLILQLGQCWFSKHGIRQVKLVRNKMREMGRLLCQLRKHGIQRMEEALKCQHFDLIVDSIKSICKFTEDDGQNPDAPFHRLGKPSLALALGHSVKKMTQLLWGQAVRTSQEGLAAECQAFLELYDNEWTQHISSHALKSKGQMANLKVPELPEQADLLKLKEYIDKEIAESSSLLKEKPSDAKQYERLCVGITSRIILFNRRRAMEASKISMTNFLQCINQPSLVLKELQPHLSPFEQSLAEK